MKTLIVLTGPTGVGKSAVALELASRLGTEIISADSRQVYAGIPIITAAPGPEDLARVPHHFVGTLPVDAYFSAAEFERQALEVLEELFEKHDVEVVCGGSMLYVDALCHGIDELPTISPEVRARVAEMTQR
ncbi:MAG: tRNA (adenosine(37)-N6)-dimethylallyltransferase MiaA, partial [Muribaculaceae bacterium]|nr:tRNA (adenosine(37)-N6)-dimethylallyltransferase MiaA [Muribaculaceae bacterium]